MSRLGQQDVGHEGVITGRDGFSLRSPTARSRVSSVTLIPKESPSLHYNQHLHSIHFNKMSSLNYDDGPKFIRNTCIADYYNEG